MPFAGDTPEQAAQKELERTEIVVRSILATVARYGPPIAPGQEVPTRNCCTCGNSISEARLRAIPNAIRCKDCESGN